MRAPAFALGPVMLAWVTGCSSGDGTSARPIGPYGPGWSAVHADSANTNYLPISGAHNLVPAWKREFPSGTINLGPTSDGQGRLYVTTSANGCHLYVFDQSTGEQLWCSEAVNKMAVASSPLLDREGRAFLSDDQTMYAFLPDGSTLWSTPIDGVPLSSQFTPDGKLLFITHVGRLYLLDRDTGASVIPMIDLAPGLVYRPGDGATACMKGKPECPAANTLAIDQRSGRFYFTFWTPGVPQAGIRAMQYTASPTPAITPSWTNDNLPEGSGSSPLLTADGKRILVTDNAGTLHALDVETGNFVWSTNIGYSAGGNPSISPDGVVMPAGGKDAPLTAIRDQGTSAEVLWAEPALQNRGIATQAGGGVVYATVQVGPQQYDLVVADLHTGAELGRQPLPGAKLFGVGTTLSLDGHVFVPTFDAKLFAFAPQ
jgi:outer membrane protein assembly factor BamB